MNTKEYSIEYCLKKKLIEEELMRDSTQYCCYCGTEKSGQWGCCGEAHYETYREMDEENQHELLAYELEKELKRFSL